MRIDQSGKFSIMTLLRAMDQEYSDNANLLRIFFPTDVVKVVGRAQRREDRRQAGRGRRGISGR